MEREFAEMLRKALDARVVSEEEEAFHYLGTKDTVKLNRDQFRKMFGKMAGIEASDTDKDHTTVKIGRLCVLENLLGREKYVGFMNTLGFLLEEHLFGIPGGEPSEYRVTEDNVTKKDGEY